MATLDRIHLDFQIIPTGDPKTLVVMDVSTWGVIEDKPAIIEIIPPGSSKKKVYNFVKGKSNVFNSSNLLMSSVGTHADLNDGIYSITVTGSPDTYCKQRYYLKTDKFQLELDKLYMSLGIYSNGDKEVDSKRAALLNIDSLIKTADSFVRAGRVVEGIQYFKRAYKKLKSINNCKDC